MRQQHDAGQPTRATEGVRAAGHHDGDPSPRLSVAHWQEQVSASGVDLNDARLWARTYLAPAYEAHLVERIAQRVVEILRAS